MLFNGGRVQTPDAFEVAADVPGVAKDSIRLHVDGDVLSLEVEQQAQEQVRICLQKFGANCLLKLGCDTLDSPR